LEQDAIELAARDRAQRDAQSAARIARMRYEAGGISLAALLDAQRQELQATLDRTRAEAQRLSDTAALYQALGAKP
jgi:outer membrane protein TolC